MHSGNHWNQQEIEKNRATPHHENDRESASPNQRSQVTKLRHQNMPVDCQGMHRADIPAVNRFEGTSSSKKRVSQDHRIVRKVRKRTDNQYEVSAIFTMRLENLCECRSRIFQIEIMGAFFGVSLNLLRSGIRCHDESPGRDAKVLKSTKVSQSSWMEHLVSVPTLRTFYFQFPIWRINLYPAPSFYFLLRFEESNIKKKKN